MLTLPSATKVAIREVTKPSAEVTLPKIRVPKNFNYLLFKAFMFWQHIIRDAVIYVLAEFVR